MIQESAKAFARQLLDYRKNVLKGSQREMVEAINRIAGGDPKLTFSTYRRMEAGDPSVSLRYWIMAWETTKCRQEVIEAAEPDEALFDTLMDDAAKMML